jgi:hypothetical protein
MAVSLFPSALKIKAIRRVPEGSCKRCGGTGNGEEIADLGEALFNGGEFPIRECKSCRGSGMATERTEITVLGLTLLFVILASIWIFPVGVRWIFALSLASIAILEATFGHYQNKGTKAGPSELKPVAREFIPHQDLPGPTTEGVLALNDAVESQRQIVADRVESDRLS